MYYFDEEASHKAISFIETFCSHTKGELTGKPLLLEEWQKEIVGNIFGWKNKKTGLRKYRTVFIEVPRKNGKTTLASSIALYMLFADSERGAEIYACAGDRNQAGIVFEIAKGMILQNPELNKRGKVFRNSITNERKRRTKQRFMGHINNIGWSKKGAIDNCYYHCWI
jgi:phage terminase large subunit-like protein